MEKLLSTAKKEGGKYAVTVEGQRTKNISYSWEQPQMFFANARANTQKLNLFQDVLS